MKSNNPCDPLMSSSDFRKAYLSQLHDKELPMRDVYAKFQAELNNKYKERKAIPSVFQVSNDFLFSRCVSVFFVMLFVRANQLQFFSIQLHHHSDVVSK